MYHIDHNYSKCEPVDCSNLSALAFQADGPHLVFSAQIMQIRVWSLQSTCESKNYNKFMKTKTYSRISFSFSKIRLHITVPSFGAIVGNVGYKVIKLHVVPSVKCMNSGALYCSHPATANVLNVRPESGVIETSPLA